MPRPRFAAQAGGHSASLQETLIRVPYAMCPTREVHPLPLQVDIATSTLAEMYTSTNPVRLIASVARTTRGAAIPTPPELATAAASAVAPTLNYYRLAPIPEGA